jgi:UDP-glucose:(heptosyl)LPS alpha-1,3-glucosyltransferase
MAVTIENLDVRRGGAEVATLRLVRQLAARGHEVHLLTRACREELPVGVTVHLVSTMPWTVALRNWTYAKAVARHLRHNQYDLTIACGRGYEENVVWAQNGANAAASEGEVRAYYFNRAFQLLRRCQDFYSPKGWVYQLLERKRVARSPMPYVIAVSEMVAEDYRRFYGVARDRIRVVHNQVAIDSGRFDRARLAGRRDAMRVALGLPSDALTILCVAQNFKRKGVRPLIEAAARLRRSRDDFRVVVVGATGRHASRYAHLAGKLGCGDAVMFREHYARVEELYAAADVFCLPTFYDPCSLTVIEAMASGLVSVTSRFNGASELMTDGVDGFILQNPADSVEMAGVLGRLFDPALRARVAAKGAETVERLRSHSSAADVVSVLEEIAGQVRRERAK